MSNFIKLPLVVLLAGSVAACDATSDSQQQKTAQRDVYHSLEDCVADWGDTELCENQMKEAREHAEKMAKASGSSSATILPIFMGPTYYGGDRSVTSASGQKFTPAQTTAARTANYTTNATGGRTVSYSAPSTGNSSSAARGGIGGHGSSASSGG